MRDIKHYTKEDFAAIAKAGRLAAETLDHISDFVKKGTSTEELDTICQNFIESHGAICSPLNYRGFPKATCISLNHVVCHGIPSEAVFLKEGDILNIDVTVTLDGYFGDTSRMYIVGKPSIKAVRLIRYAYASMWAGIKKSIAGHTLGDIGYAIEKKALEAGFSVVTDYCGHGIGTAFHEPPSVLNVGKKGGGSVLSQGMCFTVEPMVNIGRPEVKTLLDNWTVVTRDKTLSAQFEHTIGLQKEGTKILTLSPKKLFIPGLDEVHQEVVEKLELQDFFK